MELVLVRVENELSRVTQEFRILGLALVPPSCLTVQVNSVICEKTAMFGSIGRLPLFQFFVCDCHCESILALLSLV